VVGIALINLFVLVLTVLSLSDSYRQRRENAEVASRNLADGLERGIATTVERIDFALNQVADEFAIDRLGPTKLHETVSRVFLRLPDVDTMGVCDAEGRLTFTTWPQWHEGISLADRDYFRLLRDEAGARMVISKPVAGRITGRPQLVFARRLEEPGGAFAGVVFAVLTVEQFARMFAGLDLGPQGVATLRDADYGIIARTPASPHPDAALGSTVLAEEFRAMAVTSPLAGTFTGRAGSDKVERTISYRRIRNTPMTVFAGLAVDDILAGWRIDLTRWLGLAALFSATSLLLFRMIHRAWRRTDASLAEAEIANAKLEAFQQNTPIGLAVISTDRIIRNANAAVGEMFHVDVQSIVGRSTAVLFAAPEQFEDLGRRAYRRILAGETFRHVMLVRRHDGSDFWCRLLGRLVDVRDPGLGVAWVAEDITRQKTGELALRESEERYRGLVESQSDLIVRLDLGGHFVFVNDAFARAFGRDAEDIVCDIWQSYIHDDDLAATAAAIVQATSPPAYRGTVENRILAPAGLRWVSWEGGGIRDVNGDVVEVQAVGRDITEWVAYRERLKTLVADLDASNRELEQFAYVASHDLREPLRMISSYIALLERRYADKLDDEAREFFGFAREGATRMDRMVLDLLEFSRVGRRDESSEPVSLGDAAGEAIGNLTLAIEDAGARVSLAADLPTVSGKRRELVRLFQNLIGNAVKYRDPARPPAVSVGARREGRAWVVWVSDNGIGIAEEYFQRVFSIFQRLHSRTAYEGTGIGLAICRKVVEHHGGRIWIESQPGVGSTFLFTLPDKAKG
jgi:PAS domain S-box-containing protein